MVSTQVLVSEVLESRDAMFKKDGKRLGSVLEFCLDNVSIVEISFLRIRTLTSQFLFATFSSILQDRGIAFFCRKFRFTNTGALHGFDKKIQVLIKQSETINCTIHTTFNKY